VEVALVVTVEFALVVRLENIEFFRGDKDEEADIKEKR
jgi:hypothetical protein